MVWQVSRKPTGIELGGNLGEYEENLTKVRARVTGRRRENSEFMKESSMGKTIIASKPEEMLNFL